MFDWSHKKRAVKVALLIPTLNEVEGMKEIMPRIKKEWVDEIVVIDGGSVDGTVEYAEQHGYRVYKQVAPGIPNAYREALDFIKSDVAITFSPDGNSIPELIPPLVEKMQEGYDMAVVSRYLNGAKSEDDDTITRFGNWLFTTMINVLFGGRYTDTLVMFRAWKTKLFRDCGEEVGAREGCEPYLCIKCAREKLNVTEISGDEPKRIGGERKMNPLLNGWGCLSLIVREAVFPSNKERNQRAV